MNASHAQRVYQYVRKGILDNRLALGSSISEVAMSKELGVSRTPVREAIRHLQAEGLVEQIPRYGTFVRMPSLREIGEHYELRLILERHSAGKAARRITAKQLATLRRSCEQIRQIALAMRAEGVLAEQRLMAERLNAESAFHMTIARAAGSRTLYKFIENLRIINATRAYIETCPEANIFGRMCMTYLEHWRVYRALARRDANAAARAMARHLKNAHPSVWVKREQQRTLGHPIEQPSAPFRRSYSRYQSLTRKDREK